MLLDLTELRAGTDQAKLANLPLDQAAVLAQVPPGADVTLSGSAPVRLHLRPAHTLHDRVCVLTNDSPITGPVENSNHNPR